MSPEDLNIISLAISIIILGYSAWSDFKTREVSDRVWIIYLPISSILLSLRLVSNPQLIHIYAASIIITVGISILMFQTGLFGGADLKALICLSVALPTHPTPNRALVPPVNPIFPLTVLYNAYLLSLSVIVYVLAKNLEWRLVKKKSLFNITMKMPTWTLLLTILTGYKTTYKSLREKPYLYPLVEASGNIEGPTWKLKLFIRAESDRDDLIRRLGETQNNEEVWVTPGIPLLVYLLVAVISCTFAGDLFQLIIFNAL
ncbi:MAG: A24 family peptidase C-terminal domain-containing protein [Candidatus Bathyarchaeia archaeon]